MLCFPHLKCHIYQQPLAPPPRDEVGGLCRGMYIFYLCANPFRPGSHHRSHYGSHCWLPRGPQIALPTEVPEEPYTVKGVGEGEGVLIIASDLAQVPGQCIQCPPKVMGLYVRDGCLRPEYCLWCWSYALIPERIVEGLLR